MNINIRDLLLAAVIGFALGVVVVGELDPIFVHGTAPGPLLVEYHHKNYQLVEVTGSSLNPDPANTLPLPTAKPQSDLEPEPQNNTPPWIPYPIRPTRPTNVVDCRAPSRPPCTAAAR